MKVAKPTSRRSRKRDSFTHKHARSLKIKLILSDIAEARSYDIQLHELSLNELYAYLRDVRQQKLDWEARHPREKFLYDAGESQQFPYEDDGLAELGRRVRSQFAGRKSQRKHARF